MQEQAVKLFGQQLNELNILGFPLFYSFLMLWSYYCDCCHITKVFVRLHTLLLVRPLLIPPRLAIIEGIYFTDKILTSALASSGKAVFFRLLEGDSEKQKMEKLAR